MSRADHEPDRDDDAPFLARGYPSNSQCLVTNRDASRSRVRQLSLRLNLGLGSAGVFEDEFGRLGGDGAYLVDDVV